MHVDPHSGLLDAARYCPSPNHDMRSEGATLDLIVVHNISLPPSRFGGDYIEQLFTNRLNPDEHPYFRDIADVRVSAHCLIRRDGELLQFVPFHLRAWHAGQSCYRGREACNDFSIGIELEGDDFSPFEESQYQSLAALVWALHRAYGIGLEEITGHSDIAPGRKTDPGPYFEWSKLRRYLDKHANNADTEVYT